MSGTTRIAETFPPGTYLRDELEARGWTIGEFAEILGRPTQAVSEILNGRKAITATTAKEIGGALGTSPDVWLNLQNAYLLKTQGPAPSALTEVTRKAKIRARVPVAEIRRLGWIPASQSLDQMEAAVCKLLGVSSLDEEPQLSLAARRANTAEPLSASQQAWLGRVRQLGLAVRTAPFDADRAASLAALLGTRLSDPTRINDLPGWFARTGIAVVFVRALKGSKIDGVAIRANPDRVIIGLSGRGNRFDGAVFTLAHELAHVVLGHLENSEGVLLDEDLHSATETIEQEANIQANQWLFPHGISIEPPYSRRAIQRAAASMGCHPSLLVGNLQWNGKLAWSHLNGLIPRLSELLPEFSGSPSTGSTST